jgi:hypothetical protein
MRFFFSILGTIPSFESLSKIRRFIAYENGLSGFTPEFEACLFLEEIVLFGNNISGTLPSFHLRNLKILDLSQNRLFGSMPSSLNIPSIRYISLSRNILYGILPEYYSKMYQLRTLDLSYNRLTGSIPQLFWNLANLISINLRNNYFSGDIGEFISPITTIGQYNYTYEILILDNNRLSGSLNWWIFQYAKNIRKFSIKNNFITFIDELPNLLEWNHLDLTGNPLSGTIPDSYVRFSKMEYFGFKNTNLNHGTSSYLPVFLSPTESFNLQDSSMLYMCPEITSRHGLMSTKVDLDANYFDYSLCKCLPNYFGYGKICKECPRECDCSDGTSLKGCFASPNVADVEHILPCPHPDACHTVIPKKHSNTTTPSSMNDLCKRGYEGHACSKCSKGYGKQGRLCTKCNKASVYSTLIVIPIFYCFFIGYLFFHEVSSSGYIDNFPYYHNQTYLDLFYSSKC